MAIALRSGTTRLLCPNCDADHPFKSPKIYTLIKAVQSLKDSGSRS
ncbi:Uncharacterised protein [Mycobacterium tuberculosis]|nr:Uncharacterised protein [Mycobacterium tuberculosis]